MNSIKLVAAMLSILAIADVVLFAFRRISVLLFWIVIIFCALMAYLGIPYMKKKMKSSEKN